MRKQVSDRPQWYPEVFRANRIALQENVWRLMMCAICGENCSECFAKLVQDGLWQKMYGDYYQVKMDGSLEEFSATWPAWGVMCGGTVFQPALLVRRFGVNGLPLWPRPLASDGEAWKKVNKSDVRTSIWNCLESKHNDRTFYHFMWHGLSLSQTSKYYEMMMGFPTDWTDLNA